MDTKQAYIALNLLPNIGPIKVRRLLDRFGSPQEVLAAAPAAIAEVRGIGPQTAAGIADWRNTIDLDAELRRIDERELSVLTPHDALYPAPLREIYDPPLVLYVWGRLEPSDTQAIAIVGSRRTTHYGTESARKFGFQLAHSGLCVVSGLARGIDTAAHEGALASGGRTVAVIGSGLAQLYPPENQALAERIAAQGAVVSEFPVDMPPSKSSFPLRNRIVSGWSRGVLVIEAPTRSGALITAGQAAEQGREVYALPGRIDRPTSAGCNRLIQDGARLVTCAADVLEDLDAMGPAPGSAPAAEPPGNARTAGLDDLERSVYDALDAEEQHIDQIAEAADIGIAELSAALMKLEMKRLVRQLPGKYYVKLD